MLRREATDIIGRDRAATVDAALSHATRLSMQRHVGELYRDYHTAVFEPGLSPAQRRLLFGAAIEQLDIPLPRAEMQPSRRADGW